MDTFKTAFTGDIVTPDDPGYAEAIARWAANAVRPARFVFFPRTPEDVSLAIKYAVESKVPLAIKGGGHSPSGASSRTDGIVIDLGKYLNTVTVDPEAKLAYVGGGAVWKTVDVEGIKHGLATVGGTVNHTGVGGLILGGGYGWLSAEHGLVIDNLVQATVVTASGTILTASARENPDLFFGIRGGGCNFGAVTEFVLKLHPQRKTVYAGMMAFPAPMIGAVRDVLLKWWKTAGEKEGVGFVLTRAPTAAPICATLIFYNGTEEEGKARFKPLIDLGPVINTAGEIPFEKLNEITNHIAAPGVNYYFKGAVLLVSSFLAPPEPGADDPLAQVQAAVIKHSDPALKIPFHTSVVIELFPVKKIMSGDSTDEMAFRNRGEQNNLLALVPWPTELGGEEPVNEARRISHEITAIVDKANKPMGDNENTGYGNYEDAPELISQEKAKRLFGSSYEFLRKVKATHDPNNIFNTWFPIEPATSTE